MGGAKLLTMTSREKIEKIREIIKEYNLDKPGRQRGKVYMRFYLFNLLKREQFNLRFQRATGQVENTARIRQIRRDIARLKTVQSQQAAAK